MKTAHDVLEHKQRGSKLADIISVTPIATVFDAIELMSDFHVGALPVIQEEALVGIISERDYARKVILRDRSSKSTRVSEIMTCEVISVTTSHRVDECIDLMKEHHIRHLVVVEDGRVLGLLSLRDLFTEIIDEQAETLAQLEHYIRGEP